MKKKTAGKGLLISIITALLGFIIPGFILTPGKEISPQITFILSLCVLVTVVSVISGIIFMILFFIIKK